MRRPVIYLAGLLLATGASFALTAGPASAAVSHDGQAAHTAYNPFNNGDEWYLVTRTNSDADSFGGANSDSDARNNSGSAGGGARVDVTNTAINSAKDCGGESAQMTESATVKEGAVGGLLCFLL